MSKGSFMKNHNLITIENNAGGASAPRLHVFMFYSSLFTVFARFQRSKRHKLITRAPLIGEIPIDWRILNNKPQAKPIWNGYRLGLVNTNLLQFPALAQPTAQAYSFTLCRRSAFSTTETELRAIAAPASQGARKPAAATGMPIVL